MTDMDLQDNQQDQAPLPVVHEDQSKPTSNDHSQSKTKSFPLWLKSLPVILIGVLFLCLLILTHNNYGLWEWLQDLPWFFSLLIFILLFTMVSFPFAFGYVLLLMMCGYLYGFARGMLIVSISVLVGFTVAFVVCRSLFKDYTRGLVSSNNTLKAILQVVDGPNGFRILLLIRLTPIPFGLQTVLFAVTHTSLCECLLASIIGLLPLQLLNTYIGSTIRNMQEVSSDKPTNYLVFVVEIFFSAFLMWYVIRKARKEIAKHTRTADIEAGTVSYE